MLWTVIWCGDNRERFKRTVRQRFPRWPLPGDVGDLAASRFEEEVALHPLPSPELPQIMEDCVFAFGGVRLVYHIDSGRREAEVREVHDAT